MSTRSKHSLINCFGEDKYKQLKPSCKEAYAKKLYSILMQPMSRRMASTELGYTDQTYMVTQLIHDWLMLGNAQIIGVIKCERSNRMVQKITTNKALFNSEFANQTKLIFFDSHGEAN